MFKNIFPNLRSRLVYMAGPETQKLAEEAIKAQASPEDMETEAKNLSSSIDDYAKAIQEDVNRLKSEANNVKIDLNDPSSYESLDQDRWSVVESLAEAKKALNEGATRTNLDYVRIKLAAATAFYDSMKLVGDPFGASAELRNVEKAKPEQRKEGHIESRETREAMRWADIADKAMRLAYMPDTENNRTARAELQNELKELAIQVMKGKNTMKKGVVTIDRAPGEGTPAFRIVVERTTRLEQGGRPGAPDVKRVETVYAGGSEKDFPKKA